MAALAGRITPVLVVAILAEFFMLPAFALLYTLDQKGLPPEEGARRERPTSLYGIVARVPCGAGWR
jgi:hypothetical protein